MIANMEVCTGRGISNLLSIQPKLVAPNQIHSVHCKNPFPLLKQVQFNSGLRYRINSSMRPSTSEETSSERTQYDADEPEPEIIVETTNLSEKKEDYDTQLNEAPQEGSLVDNLQFLKFLEEFDIKFDYEDTYSLLVFGGGGAVALWLAAAVVGAIDSIPLFPKMLELIGLGYTIWFSSRYLLFKENRDELVTRVEQIKQQVLGSKDN
ncbi:CURVATURE THYLAKOID 1D-like protein [Perilla frutescens var. hirtella]|nr:CURVATURE THYLAKOID 1D-like protein [Perilla frutescens var. frutescens]KAH6784475.1 CURVATURE THYLAKOID 1D-like protein [Perilla frutescens var. hirtella]